MALLLTSLVAACSSGSATDAGTTGAAPATTSAASATTSTAAPTSAAATTATPTPSATTTTPATPASCAARIVEGLDPAEQAGQLLMVGLDDGASRTSLDRLVARRHLGGVILLGGWAEGTTGVRSTTRHLEGLASPKATAGLGLLIAADQEGGAVQQLKGTGFSTIPSARVQGRGSAADLEDDATRWGRQLKTAGINVNLAPVADTVPASLGTANGPIGRYGRQFSSDPERVATMVPAFVAGMRAGGVASTVKHFPGIGRIVGNTDVTARGITDSRTTADDPYLEPFAAGIASGVDLVMVGSAIYSKLDPGTNAAFSKAIVTDLLRGRLGYSGVVITDDVGAAKAVSAIPVGARATRFVDAGGDIVLSAPPSTIPTMHDALTTTMKADPAFAAKVRAAATRVVDLKLRMKLATCP
ncbi:beta-N-acetylhexosaminidase [Humibacillus xanthopallidus]|uniref:beta-N-acetylhexosaminidase n=1 Tax=Humibacillus xanthopallidus TaxID=412689 RepID=A0A543I0H1_9MICO|nr:beta-N-acetylhexosaminidase [Humibacillus xanthopallidus]